MDMLTFSKEREPDLTTANLNEVVADVIELMRVRADEEQVDAAVAAGRGDAGRWSSIPRASTARCSTW